MPLATLLWSGVLYLLQRGTTGVVIFLVIWSALLIFMLDDIAVVTYGQDWLSGEEEKRIKLYPEEAGLQFATGATAFLALCVSTFFVNFYEDPRQIRACVRSSASFLY
jgi:hypothetical protein